jgi:hypothetical protein
LRLVHGTLSREHAGGLCGRGAALCGSVR